jgi:hypothetical protein
VRIIPSLREREISMETLDLMTPEQFVVLHKGAYLNAGDTKGASSKLPKSEALKRQFVQTNPKNSQNLIVIDVDDEEAELWIKGLIEANKIPEPSYITYNPFRGTAQLGFFITEGVGTSRGKDFFKDVRSGLNDILGGDPAYNNSKARNPLHQGQATQWGTSKLYTLKELRGFIKTKPRRREIKNPLPEVGRHNILFNRLASFSYTEWRKPNFETRIMLEAQRINAEFELPLPTSSLVTTVRSIEGFIRRHFSEKTFRKIQSARGKKSAAKRHGPEEERLENKRRILAMRDAGLTVPEIAEQEGKSVKTMYQALSRARKELEG